MDKRGNAVWRCELVYDIFIKSNNTRRSRDVNVCVTPEFFESSADYSPRTKHQPSVTDGSRFLTAILLHI